jgi:mono/diheme cytochrome c family protein
VRGRTLWLALLIAGAAHADADAPVDAQRARLNYMLNCQGCHLPDGSGVEDAVPQMNGFVGNFLHIPGGREFLVRVPGSANAALDDASLAELLNWILVTMSPAELPPSWMPYTAAEVGKLRSAPLREVEEVRARLVQSIEQQL